MHLQRVLAEDAGEVRLYCQRFRPLFEWAGVVSQRRLQRALSDFGTDESFHQAPAKLREHYGIEVLNAVPDGYVRIRRPAITVQPHEPLETAPVRYLILQLLITQAIQLLYHQPLEHQYLVPARGARMVLARGGPNTHQQRTECLPVHHLPQPGQGVASLSRRLSYGSKKEPNRS